MPPLPLSVRFVFACLTSVSFNGSGSSTPPMGLYLSLNTQISQSIYQMKPGVQCLKEQSMLTERESEMERERIYCLCHPFPSINLIHSSRITMLY